MNIRLHADLILITGAIVVSLLMSGCGSSAGSFRELQYIDEYSVPIYFYRISNYEIGWEPIRIELNGRFVHELDIDKYFPVQVSEGKLAITAKCCDCGWKDSICVVAEKYHKYFFRLRSGTFRKIIPVQAELAKKEIKACVLDLDESQPILPINSKDLLLYH